METKDDLLPGDISIPTCSSLYKKYGWFITSWYWLGIRNTGSILWYFGRPAPTYLAIMTDEQKQEYGITQTVRKFGAIKLIYGWNVYRDWYDTFTYNGFWATPYFSLRIAK